MVPSVYDAVHAPLGWPPPGRSAEPRAARCGRPPPCDLRHDVAYEPARVPPARQEAGESTLERLCVERAHLTRALLRDLEGHAALLAVVDLGEGLGDHVGGEPPLAEGAADGTLALALPFGQPAGEFLREQCVVHVPQLDESLDDLLGLGPLETVVGDEGTDLFLAEGLTREGAQNALLDDGSVDGFRLVVGQLLAEARRGAGTLSRKLRAFSLP